jgi:signal transduction histidine kinase
MSETAGRGRSKTGGPSAREVIAVARTVLGDLDLEVVLQRLLATARELTGARYAAVGVLDESKRELARFITSGMDEATAARIGALPTGRGVLGELITHPVPLRLENVSSHPSSYGFPEGHPDMASFLGVPLIVEGSPYGNLYLTDKADGLRFTAEDEEAALLLAELAGLAIDHARRYAGLDRRRADLERSVSALEATMEIAGALAGLSDVDAVLQLVAERGRALVGARVVAIEIQEGEELVVAAGAGELEAEMIGLRFSARDTVAARALGSKRTQRLSDRGNLASFRQHGLGRYNVEARDGLVVPMALRGEAYGVLLALDRTDEAGFGPDQQRLLEAFASSAAAVVATARSAAEERRRQVIAAAETERGRWARELHDETLQALASVRLILSAARRLKDPAQMSQAIDTAVAELQRDMANLRALITDLRPGALDQLGVEPALVDLTDRVAAGGLELDVHLDLAFEQGRAQRRLVSELETTIYRVVQEALTNVTKHSGAQRAVVEVVEEDSQVTVSVRDDGRGFRPVDVEGGYGLLGMRERVELVGGHLELDSTPGRGTTVRAVLPVGMRRADESAGAPS